MRSRRVSHYDQVRVTNQSKILRILGKTPSTRRELAKITGLSPAAVTNLTRELIGLGLVKETDRLESVGGRPPILLEFNPDAGRVIGVGLSRTKLQAALVNLGGEAHGLLERTLPSQSPEVVTECIAAAVREICDKFSTDLNELVGIGVAVPGIVDDKKGLVRLSTVLDWRQVHLGEDLENILGVPVSVQRNGNAAALAESFFGSDELLPELLYIHLGDGIGAGIIFDGRIYSGRSGRAGEIGHNIVDPHGPLCLCGNRGCLEAVASGRALVKQAQDLAAEGKCPALQRAFHRSELTCLKVIEAAKKGDPACRKFLNTAGNYIGQAIASLINLLDINTVVLGGDLTEAGDLLLKPLQANFKEALLQFEPVDVTIKTSVLGSKAGVLGAASVVVQQFLSKGGRSEKHQ